MNMVVMPKSWCYLYQYLMLIIISISSSSSYAHTITVYGFNSATKIIDRAQRNQYCLQLASFSKLNNAKNYQNQVQKYTTYKVIIKPKNIHNKVAYAVVVNKELSSDQVKKLSKNIFDKTHNTITTTHFSKKKLQKTINANKNNLINSELSIKQLWKKTNLYLSIGGGEQFPIGTNIIRVNNGSGFPTPYDVDLYSTQQTNSGVFALAGGFNWQKDTLYFPSYSAGVMWQYLFRNNINGQITQYSDPTFLNYNYAIDTTSNVILAYGKINLLQIKQISPFFMVGIGSSFNKASTYSETALEEVTPRDSPKFSNNTSSQFAYLLGAGLDIITTENLSLSAGYNYLSLGAIGTGYGVETWSNRKLAIGTNTTNEFLININYKFKNKVMK